MGLLDRLRSLVLGDVDPAEQYVVRGFHVVVENTRPDIETTVVLRRLDDALALIESVQPWRFAHLARDVDRFWIVRYPCRGAFFADTRTCMTELTFLARTDITAAPVASSILHEGIDLLAPEAGTAIGDGLGMAVHVAQTALAGTPRGKDGKVPAAIVLLSDGAQTRGTLTPLDGAARAKAVGIRVFTVALGTKDGTLGFGPFGGYGFGGGFRGGGGGNGGRRLPVRPDPVTLAAIAKETDGASYTANSATKVDAVYKELGSSIAQRMVKREVSSWFVGLAALLLVGSLGAARLTGEQLP